MSVNGRPSTKRMAPSTTPAAANKKMSTANQMQMRKEDPMIVRPSITFDNIGGRTEKLEEVIDLLIHLKHEKVSMKMGATPTRGILLHGPPGSGKTMLAHAMAGEMGIPLLRVNAPEVVAGISGDSEERLREIFRKAEAYAPCILFIDEIDAIAPKREAASKEMERRIVSQLGTCLDDLTSRPLLKVLVVGATNTPDSLDPALRRPGRFDREILLGFPNEESRLEILESLTSSMPVSVEVSLVDLAHKTPGFTGADLRSLTSEAARIASNRILFSKWSLKNPPSMEVDTVDLEMQPETDRQKRKRRLASKRAILADNNDIPDEGLEEETITAEDFAKASTTVQPSAKREGFPTIPDISWDDVGALSDIRNQLELEILAPVKYHKLAEELGNSSASGVLLCGPPGCGKTLLAKAIANESGLSFISVKGAELLNMYVGESERSVRQLFLRAKNAAPSVIFFDEIDAICPRRSESGDNNVTSRIVNQLLTELDGLEPRKQVFIIGATNRPDMLDPAMLRPGRFDKLLFVDLPDEKARLEILRAVTKNATRPRFDLDVSLENIASITDRYSGADLASLVQQSVKLLMRDILLSANALQNKNEPSANDPMKVHAVKKIHLDEAFLRTKVSVTDQIYRSYIDIKKRLQSTSFTSDAPV